MLRLSDRLAVLPQYCLPKLWITLFAGVVANWRGGASTTRIIAWFVKRYQVNMDEALQSDISQYASFNDFFTRALKPQARPFAAAAYVCPVDGAMSEFGSILQDQIFQAKGHSFSTRALLGGDEALAARFDGGQFANIYLSPKDYHRIHMPCAGRLSQMTYVPGSLFSVNPTTARGVPDLFARNERVVCLFEGEHGPFVMVLVGATIVGSMHTAWHGIVNPPRSASVRTWNYLDQNIVLAKGEEMGRFLLGSTVVMLFPAASMQFNQNWSAGCSLRLGEEMGVV